MAFSPPVSRNVLECGGKSAGFSSRTTYFLFRPNIITLYMYFAVSCCMSCKKQHKDFQFQSVDCIMDNMATAEGKRRRGHRVMHVEYCDPFHHGKSKLNHHLVHVFSNQICSQI